MFKLRFEYENIWPEIASADHEFALAHNLCPEDNVS